MGFEISDSEGLFTMATNEPVVVPHGRNDQYTEDDIEVCVCVTEFCIQWVLCGFSD